MVFSSSHIHKQLLGETSQLLEISNKGKGGLEGEQGGGGLVSDPFLRFNRQD